MIFRLSLCAALVAMSSVATASPRVPADKWVVNFDDAKCFASRNYGTEKRPRWLTLKEPPQRSVIQLQWLEEGPTTDAKQFEGSLKLGDGASFPVSIMDYHAKPGRFRIFQMNVPIEQFNQARTAELLELKGRGLNEELQLTDLAALLATMDRCVTDLRTVWNADDDDDPKTPNPRLITPAKTDLAGLFNSDDYPSMALENDQTGEVHLSILIDKTGKVADCSVIATSGVGSLDAMACAVIRERAHYTPAIGLDGKPARDSQVGKIRWAMAS